MSLIRSGCGFLCSSDSGYCCRSGDPSADRRIPSFSQARARSDGFADLLASDVVQEIEPLLGRQAVEDLDLEALELAVRQRVLQLAGSAVEQRLNADTSDQRGARTACGCGS